MHTRLRFALLTVVCGLTPVAQVDAAEVAGAFSQGRSRLSVTAGSGYVFDETYFVLGLGASYSVLDGLSVGLDVEKWSGNDPGIVKVSPSVLYVFYQVPSVSPYLGAFYRGTYIENIEDLDSLGGRAGVYIAAGRNTYFGAGMVYETYMDCDDSTYRSCSDAYPEVSVTVAF